MGEDLYQRQRRHFENRNKQNERLRQIGRRPEIKRYQTLAMISAVIDMALMLIMCVLFDSMSRTILLWLEGFTGLFAIISVPCAGIFRYKQFAYLRNHPNDE